MSCQEFLKANVKICKRGVVYDLKDIIDENDFFEEEVHRLCKDYKELETENERLKTVCVNLLLENMDYQWDNMCRVTADHKANRRKWGVSKRK